MRKYATALLGISVLAGCATVSQMAATGGSRSDGIVKLSYEAGLFDKVAIDETTALTTARRRCSTWGYADAEAFGGITRQCQAYSGTLGCTRWFVTKEYQCTASQSPALYAAGASTPPLDNGPSRTRAPAEPGVIDLGNGVKLKPANTLSGYCISAPDGYQGTGREPSFNHDRATCLQLI